MSKSGILITAVVLAFGLAGASMAATPSTGDGASTSAPKAKHHHSHKHSGKKHSSATTASTK